MARDFGFRKIREGVVRAVVLAACLGAACGNPGSTIGDAPPQPVPGEPLYFTFPDMPPTLRAVWTGTNAPATLGAFIPTNYSPRRVFPLLVLLAGMDGGDGRNTGKGQEITGRRDFICATMPLFKAEARKTGKIRDDLTLVAADYRLMWSLYRRMLSKLFLAVPNIDPGRCIIGGFSNGAHATAGLLDTETDEVLKRFSGSFLSRAATALRGPR